ncbi:sel1 repeat family protein [Suttonella ornithocola]|uniref:Sel1 repeat n=1 Tax=Suttonella ornithocola TaxID=279832 RepID=A0A380MXD5_9GAMM|nr:sel1 repeat family protein [Suttonella ornithocola]SUO96087.1 Uncharacterised protein [Suttonella ornithocola]
MSSPFTFTYIRTLLSRLFTFIAVPPALATEKNPFENTPIEIVTIQAEQGNTKAQTELSTRYSNTGNYADALKWAQQAAEKGEAEAQYSQITYNPIYPKQI